MTLNFKNSFYPINSLNFFIGEGTKHEFQAETRMLLDIVARSLYSEKEVFVRELISNASDALEKFRYITLADPEKSKDFHSKDRALEIHISTDKQNRTLTIQVNYNNLVIFQIIMLGTNNLNLVNV